MTIGGHFLRGICFAFLFSKSAEEEKFLDVEISLITHKLKERIVCFLGANHARTGMNEPVSWRGIWIEFGVHENEFCAALNAAAQQNPPAIVFTDADHIKLNLKLRSEAKVTPGGAPTLEVDDSVPFTRRFFGFFARFSYPPANGRS
jgi:hypothetical protein